MISRKIQVQVAMFVVVALVGVSFVGYRYAGLDRLFGGSGMPVTVELAASGGLFANSEVTCRGVPVGRVERLRLSETGVAADIRLDPSAPPIPADADALVSNRSAVGEQYLDLRPRRDSGPYLADGDVIRQNRTAVPTPVEDVLASVESLVGSVPLNSLRTVVDESGAALKGTGPDLSKLLNSIDEFSKTAVEHLPETEKLISGSRTVLATQIGQAGAITTFSRDLRLLADRLRSADPDLRKLFSVVPRVSAETTRLLHESGGGVGDLWANLLTPSRIFADRTDAVEQLLVTFPQAVDSVSDAMGPDGLDFGAALTFFSVPPCVAGYDGTGYRPGPDTSPAPSLNTNARCSEQPGSPVGVRGSQNAPHGRSVPAPVPGPRWHGTLGDLLGLSTEEGSR